MLGLLREKQNSSVANSSKETKKKDGEGKKISKAEQKKLDREAKAKEKAELKVKKEDKKIEIEDMDTVDHKSPP